MKYFFLLTTQFIGFILSVLFSTIAAAHSGHGTTSQVSHELEHLLWLSAGVSLMAYLVYCIIKKKIETR
jgi:ABC-type iron transport system FetAB permease component